MKTKNFKKKLTLNKISIALLGDEKLNQAKGGYTPPLTLTFPMDCCIPITETEELEKN